MVFQLYKKSLDVTILEVTKKDQFTIHNKGMSNSNPQIFSPYASFNINITYKMVG